MAPTAALVEAWTAAIWLVISSVARPAGIACARRLDRGVERQQVGLAGDLLDQPDHVADLLRGLREPADLLVGGGRIRDRNPDQRIGLSELLADLADRGGELLGRRSR